MTFDYQPGLDSSWRKFIELGEELMNQPSPLEQCNYIQNTIQDHLDLEISIWLLEPYYPIPGKPEGQLYTGNSEPDLVKKTVANRKPQFKLDPTENENQTPAVQAACFPIITHGDFLAVVHCKSPPKNSIDHDTLEFIAAVCAHAAGAMQNARQVDLKNYRSQQLALVQSVSAQIANIINIDELASLVTQLVQKNFEYYYVGVYSLEPDQDILKLRASATLKNGQEDQPNFTIRMGQGCIGLVAESGEEILVQDTSNDKRFRYTAQLPETRSEMALPINIEDRTLGVLDVQSDQINFFHENDKLVLRSLANNIAVAMDGAQLYNNLQKQANEFSALYDFNQSLISILDLNILTQKAVELLLEHFSYSYVHIYTVNPVSKKIIYRTGVGEKSKAMEDRHIAYDIEDPVGIIPWVARTSQTRLVNDVKNDDLYRASDLLPKNTKSELTIPIIHDEEVLGILDIQSDKKDAFTSKDKSFAESISASIAIAIRNASLYRSEKWRVQVADSFRDVAGLISANTALSELLDSILDKLEQNLPCDTSAIWFLEQSESETSSLPELKLARIHGVDEQKLTKTLNDETIKTFMNEALVRGGPTIRKPGDPIGPLGKAMGFDADYSSIAAPLRSANKPLGIIALAHKNPGRYGSEAHDMTETFAHYAAVAIQNARLIEESQEQAWISTVLLQVSEVLQSIMDIEDLLATIVRLPRLLIGVKISAIFLWDELQNVFLLKENYGLHLEDGNSQSFGRHLPAFSTIKAKNYFFISKDPEKELGIPHDSIPNDIQLILLPIYTRNSFLGAFLFGFQTENQERDVFSQNMLAILQGVCRQIAVAIENLHLEEARDQEAYVTAVLLQVAQVVVSQNELQEILETVINIIPIVVGIDVCVIYLWDKDRQLFFPAKAFSRDNAFLSLINATSFQTGQFNLLDTVHKKKEPHFIWATETSTKFTDLLMHDCFPANKHSLGVIKSGDINFMGFPLVLKDELLGVMITQAIVSNPTLLDKRMEIINGISRLLTLAIQNEYYKEELVESERIEQEFRLTRQIQQTFLPDILPSYKHWDLDALWKPARQVGGDFFDIIPLDDNLVGLIIADVSDKGMPAALYMTVSRTLIRAFSKKDSSPAEILQIVNNLLIPETTNSMFVTTFYALLDLSSGKLTYANSGHNLPILINTQSGSYEFLQKGGIALGVLENIHLEDKEILIKPGDLLFLYTDGITEAFSDSGKSYGQDRMIRKLLQMTENGNAGILSELENDIIEFRGSAPPSDDITMVMLFRHLNEE
ncbi:MAG: GAF domain-containing protein [Anaerolineaceae bacterium]|nr:GAF domain-containing protein [Anaerolineaceae bacterium]